MAFQLVPKALLAELARLAAEAPVIDILPIAERRAPLVIELETDAELALTNGGIEIKHPSQTIVLSTAVLDFIELFRRSSARRKG